MLDWLRIAIAILPLAAYANVLGLLRLRAAPTVISGAMDLLFLGLAVIGIIAIGPIELFFPRAAYSLLGWWVWIVLIALYLFILILIALNTTPRLIVYGMNHDTLRVQISELLVEQQIRSEWLGDLVDLPELGVRGCIEQAGWSCVSQIQAAGKQQSLTGWFTLERLLVDKVSTARSNHRGQAILWLLVSFVLFAFAAVMISNELPRLQQIMQSMFDG